MQFKPPLTIHTLREISSRTPAGSDARVLLWEIKRLHDLIVRLDWCVTQTQLRLLREGQSMDPTDMAARVLSTEPAVLAARAEKEKERAERQPPGSSWHIPPPGTPLPEEIELGVARHMRKNP
ncbi:hypothetical protein V8Z80_08655 [Orrella sp. JC864]|uniref:hypothetical protein n=1 Tax=Orrella sp. JC864 TaxID=3120298 RepID=UPI00300AA8A9